MFDKLPRCCAHSNFVCKIADEEQPGAVAWPWHAISDDKIHLFGFVSIPKLVVDNRCISLPGIISELGHHIYHRTESCTNWILYSRAFIGALLNWLHWCSSYRFSGVLIGFFDIYHKLNAISSDPNIQ